MAKVRVAGFGAFILGRNMFGPIRGPWPDDSWKGWWGDNPPYHAPTCILTRHARLSIELEGGTTFHFVTDGIESALRQARAAAGDKDVKIGGGVETVRQCLRAGLDLRALGFRVVERATTDAATHLVLARQAPFGVSERLRAAGSGLSQVPADGYEPWSGLFESRDTFEQFHAQRHGQYEYHPEQPDA